MSTIDKHVQIQKFIDIITSNKQLEDLLGVHPANGVLPYLTEVLFIAQESIWYQSEVIIDCVYDDQVENAYFVLHSLDKVHNKVFYEINELVEFITNYSLTDKAGNSSYTKESVHGMYDTTMHANHPCYDGYIAMQDQMIEDMQIEQDNMDLDAQMNHYSGYDHDDNGYNKECPLCN